MISVITPFYNGNKYMKQLFSILEDNYKTLKTDFPNSEMELVIVNDSPEIAVDLNFINVKFEYRVVTHECNLGIQQARVTGLDNCKGDYILFLDQDDELFENAIAKQFELLINENSDMVICNAYMESADGKRDLLYKKRTDFNRLHDLKFFLKSHNVIKSPGQCLIKKKMIPAEWKKYIMKKNGSDDLFLWILMFEKKCKITVNKEPLYIHKYTGENLSDSEEKMSISSLEIVDLLKKINYVPLNDIESLKKSREISLEFKTENLSEKMMTIFKNIDLFTYLVFCKIKRMIY
ncbi:MAG: glycosyltransferase family 2 protein [Lachnospiraceae bacterium]|nr:glycosyltransferase family 2 protein [Lachnospiraceae bacterium]